MAVAFCPRCQQRWERLMKAGREKEGEGNEGGKKRGKVEKGGP